MSKNSRPAGKETAQRADFPYKICKEVCPAEPSPFPAGRECEVFSKWTKGDIIESIELLVANGELTLICSFEKLKKLPKIVLQRKCLHRSSWHHTGKYYRETDFYSICTGAIEELTDDKLEQLALDYKKEQKTLKKEKEQETREVWECEFLSWYGTRRHRKADCLKEVGVIKGNWFYRSDGTRKSIYGNGFGKIRKLSEENIRILKAKKAEEEALVEEKWALMEKERVLMERKKRLFKYQTEFKTLSEFLESEHVNLDELEKIRKKAIEKKREELREIWEQQNCEHKLARIDEDEFVDRYIKNHWFEVQKFHIDLI